MAIKDKSLLEIAIEVVGDYKRPVDLMTIAKETMEKKGFKTAEGKEAMPRFICDFMESGYFVYCDNGLWDLKERQPLSSVDKDVSDFGFGAEFDEEIKQNELKTGDYSEEEDSKSKDTDDTEIEPEEDEIESELKEMKEAAESAKKSSLESEDVQLGYDEDSEDEEDQ